MEKFKSEKGMGEATQNQNTMSMNEKREFMGSFTLPSRKRKGYMLLVGVGKGTKHQDGRGVNFSINLKSLAKSLATATSF